MVKKLVFIVLILIALIAGLSYIFNPTTKLINNLKKINGTNYVLENNNKMITYYNRSKIAIYPTKNFIAEELTTKNNKWNAISLYVKTRTTNKYGTVAINITPIQAGNAETTKKIMELSKTQEPKICKSDKELNYFVYNGRNYLYIITSSDFIFYTPINNDYLYCGTVFNYQNLTKEDIESILYFEAI